MTKQKKAYTYTVLSIIIWSTVASAFKIALQTIDFLNLILYSSFVSTIILFLIILFSGKIKELKKYSKRDYISSLSLGLLNPALYYIVLFAAYSRLPAQVAQPLNYTWPIILTILSFFILKQDISFKKIIAITISFIGVIIISFKGQSIIGHVDIIGILLALTSAIIWAIYWIFNTKNSKDETIRLFFNFLFGFIIIIVISLVTSNLKVPSFNNIFGIIYIGLFEMGITFIFWQKALKLSKDTAIISNLSYLIPFISLIFIYFIVGEKIMISTILGLILIIGGILIQKETVQVKD